MPESKKITLTAPIQSQGQTVSEIELRVPNGGDIADCGMPFDLGGKVDAASLSQYISKLGNIPPSSVKQMSAPDFMQAVLAITSFFGDSGQPTHSEPTTTSPGSSTT